MKNKKTLTRDLFNESFFEYGSRVGVWRLLNLFERYGFEKIFINSNIRGLFKYTGIKKPLWNNYDQVILDLKKGERRRSGKTVSREAAGGAKKRSRL